MKVVFVSGPYRATNPDGTVDCYGIEQNRQSAMQVALAIARLGAIAICPHGNMATFYGAPGVPESHWLAGTMELLRRADAVYMAPFWRVSQGALDEKAAAEALGLPVFTEMFDMASWLTGGDGTGVR